MALHLEANRRVLLHILSHLLNLRHRLWLERRLARLEENVVGHELTRLGNGLLNGSNLSVDISLLTLVEIYCTLGNHHVLHVGGALILVT